jgi:hypothetical protein
MHRASALLALLVSLGLAACSEPDEDAASDAALIATDPVIARALHDPLLTDPDLASRNEANAAIGFPDSHALPVLGGTSAEAQAAREAMRLALLEGGALADLPPPQSGSGGPLLGPMAGPDALLAAVGAPMTCADRLREDFALAASVPPPAALPPLAMVVQAGGADAPGCGLRIVRYLTAAPPEDVLQFHFVIAQRAGLEPARFAVPGESIAAKGEAAERLAVHVGKATNGLTGVTLAYRAP